MKTRSRKGRRQFQLNMLPYGNYYYIELITRLEAALNKKPRSVQLNMVGVGEIPADMALLIRSVLMKRSPKTRIITNARNSLQGGSVLVWLLGDRRIIRDDARLHFRRVDLSEDDETKPKEIKELAGRLIEMPVLRQFGLVENDKVDQFLTTAFRKSERALVPR